MFQDLRFTFRLMAKERWFAAAAIVALALGIGVNAIGFSIVNAAFLRGLPFANADRLYVLTWQRESEGRANISYADLEDWRAGSRAFAGLAAYSGGEMTISDDRGWPEEARAARVTANAFDLVGQQPLLGRGFAPGDDRQGAEPVVLISHSLWRNRYGADPGVLGKPLRVSSQAATIIGVMPEGMNFPENNEIWVPLIPTADEQRRDGRRLNVFGLVRDGGSRREAQTEMSGMARQLVAAYPDAYKELTGVRVETFTERFVGGPARVIFIVIMGAVGFVLLIACANVANLLLSRSAFRTREMALRMAIGATRWRVVRQLLVESVVLAFIGGSLGLLLTVAGVRFVDASVQDPGKPFWIVFTLDRVVFGYVAAICVVTAIVSGLAPALHVSKSNNADLLKEGARGSAGSRRVRWFSGALIVAELALTIVLLVGAGLMMRSFMKLHTLDLGIRTENLLTMRLRLPEEKYADGEARRAFFERLEPRLQATPGIQSVAITTGVPPLDGGERLLEIDRNVRTTDQAPATPKLGIVPPSEGGRPVFVSTVTIGPRFFDAVGVALLRGRLFHEMDGTPGAETVIINERLASRFFGGDDPVGRQLRFVERSPRPGAPAPVWRTIVGISPMILHGDVTDPAVVYVPYRQEPERRVSLLLRSALPPATVADAVRREVQAIDPDQPVSALQTIEQTLAEEHWPLRVFGSLFVLFGVVAIVLSSVGLYAVMAYSVTQRTQEIGVRMAVGAQTGQVSWLILKLGLVQLAIGLTIGLAGALALSRVLRNLLIDISPADPITFVGITLLLTAVSIAACLVPARRATRVDPLVALRAE